MSPIVQRGKTIDSNTYSQDEHHWKEQRGKFKAEFKDFQNRRTSWATQQKEWECEKRKHDESYPPKSILRRG
jgi:hypothetical protein